MRQWRGPGSWGWNNGGNVEKLKFEIVSAERVVYSDEVDVVIVPGIEGQLAVLPQHAPLLTMLQKSGAIEV